MIIRPGRNGRRAGLGTTRAVTYGRFSQATNGLIPTNVSGLALWARSDLSVSGLSDGAAVSQINDLSGLGHHLLQPGAAGLKPIYKVSQINGQPAFRHDTSGTQFVQAAFAFATNPTVFLVYKQNAYAGSGALDIVWDGLGAGSTFVIASNTANQKWRLNAALNYDTFVANGVYDYTCAVYSATGVGRVHGTQVVSGNIASNPAGGVTIGALGNGTRGANIDWAETIWYDHALSLPEITAVERYLKTRYAL